ncbi:MAG: hypothetical protein Q7U04_11355 [Bacteriovorax sp.]|nr:hypothetical protein [Bacteriovorax sp.]
MLNFISSRLGFKKNYKIQSFTFFIPSPPTRATGYREKQFDKIFYEFINKGYRILNFTTQASTGEKQSGMWIILIVQATNPNAQALNLDEVLIGSIKDKAPVKEAIEGFYYIDDQVEQND